MPNLRGWLIARIPSAQQLGVRSPIVYQGRIYVTLSSPLVEVKNQYTHGIVGVRYLVASRSAAVSSNTRAPIIVTSLVPYAVFYTNWWTASWNSSTGALFPQRHADPHPKPVTAHGNLYNSVSPSAHLTIEQPALTVSSAPCSSKLGLTSTRSMAIRLPVSWTHSAMKSPSRRVRPPRTGVPVLGAHIGSSASTSKDR